MKKLSELFKKLWAKFKTFGKGIRIAMVASVQCRQLSKLRQVKIYLYLIIFI